MVDAGRLPIRYHEMASGAPLISVTQVLTLNGRIDSTWFTPEACWRGSLVHHLTEQLDLGEDMDPIPAELEGYLDAYWLFRQTCRPVIAHVELEVQDAALELGGRVDRVLLDLFNEPGILDIKTGPPQDWHGLQLAAYNRMVPTGARWGLYLRKNGRYLLKQYTDPMDDRKFMFDLANVQGRILPDGDFWVAAA